MNLSMARANLNSGRSKKYQECFLLRPNLLLSFVTTERLSDMLMLLLNTKTYLIPDTYLDDILVSSCQYLREQD
jgi:hypothetical protein